VSLCAQADSASHKKSLKDKFNLDTLTNAKLGIIPLPVFGYSAETGFLFGLGVDYYFNTNKKNKDSTTRESYMYVGAAYSTRKQLFSELYWQIYGKNEKYILRGKTGYSDFSEFYWGVGNQTLPEKDELILQYNLLQFKSRFLLKINRKNFLGFGLNYSKTSMLHAGENSLDNSIPGYNGSKVVGIGPALLLDYRNNPFSPTRGWFFEYYSYIHKPALGSQFNFTEQQFDARKYFKAFGKGMIGLNAVAWFNSGQVPLRELARLGGSHIMRGYVLGRYRDKQMWSAQAETRYPLGKYFALAAFGSVGQVGPSLKLLNQQPLYSAMGGGLRIKLNQKKQLYFRADYAYTSNKTGQLYLRVMDAF
jgi:hypothetical protein